MLVDQLDKWSKDPDTRRFPYDQVIDEFHHVGKHFVEPNVLAALDRARGAVYESHNTPEERKLLTNFLDITLDKHDQRYDYLTYTAVSLLPAAAELLPPAAHHLRDRQVVNLVCDALAFELAALDGEPVPLPDMRPDVKNVQKRCHHALRVVLPALDRMGLVIDKSVDEIDQARQVCTQVLGMQTEQERQMLRLSMLPVYIMHDEYMFLRVLQSFEVNFSLLAANLRAIIAAFKLDRPDVPTAVQRLEKSAEILLETAPLFSMLATMQVESFRTFRAYTVGASAIQSERYKTVEALCRRPDDARLDSLAYKSVPPIRAQVLAGQETVYETFVAARDTGNIPADELELLTAAMDSLEASHHRWRQTHYSLAVHMLGEASGSGYTEGTPYLKSVINNELFHPSVKVGAE